MTETSGNSSSTKLTKIASFTRVKGIYQNHIIVPTWRHTKYTKAVSTKKKSTCTKKGNYNDDSEKIGTSTPYSRKRLPMCLLPLR